MAGTAFVPRNVRDLARGRHAAAVAVVAGKNAIGCFEAAIDATFGESSIHNRIKRLADVAIELGPTSDHVIAWYRPLALRASGLSLQKAIDLLAHEYRNMRPKVRFLLEPERMLACNSRAHAERLRATLIMLRLMRAKSMSDETFHGICDLVIASRK